MECYPKIGYRLCMNFALNSFSLYIYSKYKEKFLLCSINNTSHIAYGIKSGLFQSSNNGINTIIQLVIHNQVTFSPYVDNEKWNGYYQKCKNQKG